MIALAVFLTLFGLVFIAAAPVFYSLARGEEDRFLLAAAWLLTFSLAGSGVLCLVAAALTFTA